MLQRPSIQLLYRVTHRLQICKRGITEEKPIVSPDVKFVDTVDQEFQKGKVTFRTHPGVTRLRSTSLPERLQDAIRVLLEKYPRKELGANAGKLTRYLWGRKAPMEDRELQAHARDVRVKVTTEYEGQGEALNAEAAEKRQQDIQRKTVTILKKQTYNWQPINYTAYNAFLYMVGRLPVEYAVVLQCLNEIQTRHPGYRPKTLYDVGSGTASVTWAAHQVWGHSLNQAHSVDLSADMNTLARLLMQDGDENKTMCLPGVHFRQFVPSSKNKYEVTVSAYTLFELPSVTERREFVADLWQKTLHYMVLIDNGTNAGFRLIMEARDFILQRGETDQTHVFAPCPHSGECPLLQKDKRLCLNEVMYKPLDLVSKSKLTEKYSYVILSKLKPTVRWPRVVQDVVKATRHTHLHVCDTDASIKHLIITKAKHSPELYKSSRYTRLGDSLPVCIPHPSIIPETPPSTVIDSQEAWSLQDTPTKVSMPKTGRYMVQCNSTDDSGYS